MAKIDYTSKYFNVPATQTVQPSPSATMLGGGRGASQAAQQAAAVSDGLNKNKGASVVTYFTGNSLSGDTVGNPKTVVTFKDGSKGVYQGDRSGGKFSDTINLTNDTSDDNGGGGDYYGGSVGYSDPYGGIYSLYDQLYGAQQSELQKARESRLNALRANYNNAKSQLDSSFASGEAEMNQNADRALREAYINNMLNQRNMNQYLAGQGITGGAAESIIANLYNTYGNNRNSIETDRMNQLKQLLANYQGTLGDIENSYLSGLADADSDYTSAINNAMTNYYGNLADIQKQNIANQYKLALSKASGSGNGGTTDEKMKSVISTVKQFKSNPAYALQVAEENGYTGDAANYILQQAGIVPSEATTARALGGINQNIHDRIIDDLDAVYQSAMSNNNPYWENLINDRMQKLAKQYRLTEEQAKAILGELGF